MKTGTASTWDTEVDFSVRISPIALILLSGLLLRLALAFLPGFQIDLGTFRAWSLQLAEDGPWNFYRGDFFSDYAPGYLHILWLLGGLNKLFAFDAGQFSYLLKLPAIAADLGSAYLLYRILAGRKPLLQLGAPAMYLLLPAALLIGPVWGQVDSLLALFLLLTVYYMAKARPIPASLAFTVAFLVKPQAVAVLPLFAFWLLKNHPPRIWANAMASSLAAGLLLIFPFFPRNPFALIGKLRDSADVYPYDTFFAYNFWGLFNADRGAPGGILFNSDDLTFLGLEHRLWGILLFLAASLAIIFVFRDAKGAGPLALATAISVLVFFVFLTRMHERYLFPIFLPLLLACVLINSRLLWASFLGLGTIHFFNLYYVYSFYNPNFLKLDPVFLMIEDRVFLLSLLTLLSFPLLLAAGILLTRREQEEQGVR
jgi:Gpi18-like mannosyltransferase